MQTVAEAIGKRIEELRELLREFLLEHSERLREIPAGSIVRLSLSHPSAPPDGPRGYWLQLSVWFRR